MSPLAPIESDNIAWQLRRIACERPDEPAVWFSPAGNRTGPKGYWSLSFRELEQRSNRLAAGLAAAGIGNGARTVLMVPPGPEFFALTFALFKAGVVPVLVDPGMGIKNLGKCLDEAEPEAFIGVPKAHSARLAFGWARRSLKTLVNVGRRFGWGGFTLEDVERAAPQQERSPPVDGQPGATAAILFTSGSTGVPKGVVYTHEIFAAQVALLRDVFKIEPGEVDLCTFPLFALFAPALGMTAVVPEMDATRPAKVDPSKIIAAIQHFGATNMFGSPALLNRVGRYGADLGVKLPSLRRVISAGAPVSAQVLERFTSLLNPGVEIFTPYGATEALPVAVIGSAEILRETREATDRGAGVCVGRPVSSEFRVGVIPIGDEPIATWNDDLLLPPGEIGEIVVKGPVVTREYFRRPQATALAKIPDGESVYHRMGDVGWFDEHGRLWFCGRKAHRVVTPEETLFTVPCEAIFNTHPQVFRSALVGVERKGTTIPVLCVELELAARANRVRLTDELLALGAAHPQTRAIRTVCYHKSFPVDIRHNSKIFREKLAVWAAHRLR